MTPSTRSVRTARRSLLALTLAVGACGGSDSTSPLDPAAAARDALLDVRSDGCGPRVGFGTATLVDDTLALTAAHVVAGAESVSVIDRDGDEHDARVVWFDPLLDIAALRVAPTLAVPVVIQPSASDDEAERGTVAVSRGAFDDREITTIDVGIPRHVNVATTDIYLDTDVVRPGFEVTGAIEPGDSGTMVVASDGAAGIVWSRSNITQGRAWAVDVPDDFRSSAFRESLDADVAVGPCLR
ncbi:MAG: trypsin-like peptidase domain-containing protein [Ilumatobacter sp.]|uniref:trypsin-like peptidase domain-containing protein n=1 Tax=Ilumatobacter sp. TaxID=1967498 RepID=UPI003297A16F